MSNSSRHSNQTNGQESNSVSMDSSFRLIEVNNIQDAELVNDADNLAPPSVSHSIAVSSAGISASVNEQQKVHASRIEVLESKVVELMGEELGKRVGVLESKAAEGMAKLDAIQQDMKQYMANQQVYMANQQAYMANRQARYEPLSCDLPNHSNNSLFVLFSDMNRSMKGKLFPVLDNTGKIPTDFPANVADLTRLSGTIDMAPHGSFI